MAIREYSRRVVIAAVAAVLAALAVLYVRHVANLLLVMFAGLLLAVALDACSNVARRRLDVPRRAAVIGILAGGLLLLALLGWWTGPRTVDQIVVLPGRLAAAAEELWSALETTAWGRALVDDLRSGLQPDTVGRLVGGVTGAFSTAFGAMTNFLVIVFLGLFLAWNPSAYVAPLLRLVPEGANRDRAREILGALSESLQSWLIGRLESMAVVGVSTVAALLIAGVPLALALGVIAGLLSFIPFLGPLLALVPAVLIGLGESPGTALVVALIYLGIQLLETYLITPIIQRREIHLPPAFVITAQTLLGLLFGLVGVLVATPLALVGVVLVQMLYLGERPSAASPDGG